MIHQRLAQGVMLLLLAGGAFAACGSDPPSTPQAKFCDSKCKCEPSCTEAELATCTDDLLNREDEARGADCKTEYDTFITCLNAESACIDEAYDTSVCFNEETDLNTCINPPAACSTANNGICNEPPPAGDGTCSTGTDKNDCLASTCPTAGDGFCDEPEGSGTCPEGSDPMDCPAPMCVPCLSYALDTTQSLCETSSATYNAFFQCACSACSASCTGIGDLCDFGSLSSACTSCVSSLCTTEYNACIQDT